MTAEPVVVSVIVLTYNQEQFIAQTLRSIVEQEAEFNWELVVADDCSTDRTGEIIQQLVLEAEGRIKHVRPASNLGLVRNFLNAVQNCRGEYIALCGGDDYWIDRHKLKKQVDFLIQNPDFGLVHTNYRILNDSTGEIVNADFCDRHGQIFERQLEGNIIGALTILARAGLVTEAISSGIYEKGFLMEDYPLTLYISSRTKVGYLDEYTAVWRKNPESVSNSVSPEKKAAFNLSLLKVREYFLSESSNKQKQQEKIAFFHRLNIVFSFQHKIRWALMESYSRIKSIDRVTFKDRIYYYGMLYSPIRYALNSIKAVKRAFANIFSNIL